jgi:hypothetical protein
LLSLVAAVGCSKKQEKAEEKPAEGTVAENKGAPSPAAAADPLMAELKTLATTCDVNAEMATVKCPKDEERKLATDFTRKVKSPIESLKTMAAALADSDKKLQTVASGVMQLAFRTSLGDDAKPGSVSPEDAKALIDAVGAAPRRQALQAVPAAVHAAMLSGQQEALYKMLDGRSNDKLQVVAYRYLMTHGRINAFDKIKALVQSEPTDVALAALASPSTMRNWTADEQAQLCPWARDLGNGDKPEIAGQALGLLSNCSGEYVDMLLARGETLAKSGKLSQAQVAPFRDVCSASRRKTPNLVSEAQCARNRKLLENVLFSKSDARTKIMTLSAIEYQWPDEATLKLAQRFAKDGDKDMAARAEDIVKRLEKRTKAASAAPAPAAPAEPAEHN